MPAIVTDGDTWFGVGDAQVMIVTPHDYDRLCEGEKVRSITPENIIEFKDTKPCPGCGSPAGPCPDASCVREDPRSLS